MAVCPQKCITMSKHDGLYTPSICSQCTKCGYCFDICPGKGKIRDSDEKLKYEELIGKYNNIYNGWSKDEIIRHYSASGGVVTTIIHELLKSNSYDVAFVVRDFSYNHYVETCSVRAEDADGIIDFTNDESFTAKSRYIPIGHGKAVDYILKNPMQKVIIIGTSCAIRGFLNVIQQRKLKRDNYLLIGLFCESVMNYLVWDYFMQKKFTKGNTIAALHFKNKESGGWPGNIKMVFTDGSHRYYDSSYRIEVKPYLKPKRCLYCIDKLNVKADISLGDNYTGENDSALGSNTVIIRTEFGETAWKNCINKIEFKEVSEVKVIKAQ